MALAQSSTQSLRNFFSNAEDSPYCARCILGASHKGVMQGVATNGFNAFWSDFTQDLEFWNSMMRFLFAVRTEEQTRELLVRLNRCTCRLSDPRILDYHRIGRTEEADFGKRIQEPGSASRALIFFLFFNLRRALELAHIKAVAKRTAEKWPTCPEDLMPFGPESLVEGFIVWSCVLSDIFVFSVAARCTKLCGALLIPAIVKSTLTRRAVDAGRKLFDRTWNTIRLRAASTRRITGVAFITQIRPFLEYFAFFCTQSFEKRMLMMDGCEVKTLQVLSLLTYVADDPRLFMENGEHYRTLIAKDALHVYQCMGHFLDPLPSILLHPKICEQGAMPAGPKESDILESLSHGQEVAVPLVYLQVAKNAIEYIRDSRFDLHCSAGDCPNSIQSTGKDFQRCTGCNIALYCSKKCQTDAWISEDFPHKIICKILQNVGDIAGRELLFRCPIPDSVHYPEELHALVAEKWEQAGVGITNLMKICGWASRRRYPALLPMRAECEAGYNDYEERLQELSERDKAQLQAKYLVFEKSTHSSAEEYVALRLKFDKLAVGTPLLLDDSGDPY